MKICHVTNFLPHYHDDWGGAEKACMRVIKLLNRAGCDNAVIAKRPDGKPVIENGLRIKPLKTLGDFFGDGLKNKIGAYNVLGPSIDPVAFLQFLGYLKRIKPDVVHFHNFMQWLSFSLVYGAKILNIPTVLTVYDYWYFCPSGNLIDDKGEVCKRYHGGFCADCYNPRRYGFVKKILFPLRKRVFDFFLKSVDSFVTLSQSSSRILEEYGIKREKIHVVHQPFLESDYGEAARMADIEPNSILFVGRIGKAKGLHVMVDAMAEVVKKFRTAKLYIVGRFFDKEYEERIKRSVVRNNVGGHLEFLGNIAEGELARLIRRVNVVVIPEQWENMCPVFLVEAMACGKAVVASRIGGIPEFIENGKSGLLGGHSNPMDFASKIIALFENRKSALRMGSAARERVKELFNEDAAANALMGIYGKRAFKKKMA